MNYEPSMLRDAIVLCALFAMMFAVGWGCCLRWTAERKRRKHLFVARFITVNEEPVYSLN